MCYLLPIDQQIENEGWFCCQSQLLLTIKEKLHSSISFQTQHSICRQIVNNLAQVEEADF